MWVEVTKGFFASFCAIGGFLGARWWAHGHCKWQYGNDDFCSRRGRRKFRVRGQNYCEEHYIQVIAADRQSADGL
ncbi:hypothetical protein GCM10010104_46020 [Streptomyces indiaensis]|uniref:Secreted protein n=1 Tax=Streptomyces indiaensis TaxID=284033 RepID=A0ABN3DZJ3_9ACTN